MFQKKMTAADLYLKGLNHLLDGSREDALKYLSQSAREDSENVEAFFHAGNIFRDMGSPERAERVHSELLMRPSLSPEFKTRVRIALIRDTLALKKFARAEELILEAMKGVKSLWLFEEILKIYEHTREWEKAIDIQTEIDKWTGTPNNDRMALYHLECGRALMADNGHAARLKFKESIKRNPKLPWPYILISDSYFKEDRADDALEYWSKFFDMLPGQAYLLFERMEKYFYERGAYGEVGRIYSELLEREPDNPDAMLALSAYLHRRGDYNEGLSLCRKVLEINPASREATTELLKQALEGTDDSHELKRLMREMIKMYPARKRFKCGVCQNRTEQPHWRCNACGAWTPYKL